MAIRLRSAVVRRPSLPLTEDDERILALFRSEPAYRRTLAALSGESVDDAEPTEAALLHAVLVAGHKAVREAAEDAGYATIAAEAATSTEDLRAQARRRRPAWADEQ